MGIMTSNQNYYSVIDPDALDTDARDWCISNSVLADMDAGFSGVFSMLNKIYNKNFKIRRL